MPLLVANNFEVSQCFFLHAMELQCMMQNLKSYLKLNLNKQRFMYSTIKYARKLPLNSRENINKLLYKTKQKKN